MADVCTNCCYTHGLAVGDKDSLDSSCESVDASWNNLTEYKDALKDCADECGVKTGQQSQFDSHISDMGYQLDDVHLEESGGHLENAQSEAGSAQDDIDTGVTKCTVDDNHTSAQTRFRMASNHCTSGHGYITLANTCLSMATAYGNAAKSCLIIPAQCGHNLDEYP